jgi:hypothetical protein
LRDLVHPLDRQLARLCHQVEEAPVRPLHAHLEEAVGLFRRPPQQIRLPRQRRGLHAVHADADLLERALKLGRMPNTPIEPVMVLGSAKMRSPAAAIQ